MSLLNTSTSMQSRQTITAMFDSRAGALTAVEELVSAGIPRTSITVHPETDSVDSTGHYDTTRDEKGFWASLENMFMPDDDRAAHVEAMHRGAIMVSVIAEQAHVETAESILEEHGTLNLDEHEESWRTEGWAATAPVAAAPALGMAGTAAGAAPPVASSTEAARGGAAAGQDDGVISLYEEKLNVGKRQVSAGRVKIRSYVVETPVSEQVTLHSESVQVERHPVDRAVAVGDDAFRDRTLEATETAQEAVVSKTARVTEEIGLRKVAADQVKTVSDTVRHTEVEIEDERTGSVKPTLTMPKP